MPITTVVATAGFIAGIVFGATANRTNFCTMGAVSDMVFLGDLRRLRAWFLAIAVAIIGTQSMAAAGMIDITKAFYLTPNFGWLGGIVGGLMFGFGMTLGGGCGNKTLVRIGGGNLKSVIVFLVMGVFAYMTMRGLIAVARVEIEGMANIDLAQRGFGSQGIAEMLSVLTGIASDSMQWITVAIVAGGLLVFCFKNGDFRSSSINIAAGLIIGSVIVAGWWITGVLGYDEFDPTQLASFTFVGPTGESLLYLMTFTGATIDFGIAAVGGVILGSFLMAKATKSFAFEGFNDLSDMMRNMVGAALMGVGAVLSMGCTIGQGLTGMSTLAVGSVIALVSIIMGAVYGLKYLEEGSLIDALKAVFSRD
ncbi:MAG: YeeE/YedE family protein [Rhodospirillales bacterium]|nr:YeeE/YedE family protein [Rhodospirillales bacterium]MCW8862685.1 YeeE/YedE family protein [Rhodospirillales bacterium]MCW8970934.1 YeeE/YedE family protein [Rhodospirillales bacterium]MCW9002340.1 YeeE/YedE family protein [Rhodospirillales bacterium]MCW9040810.1 YeeE/YedE family protein [Rhodospirillales bacterium]